MLLVVIAIVLMGYIGFILGKYHTISILYEDKCKCEKHKDKTDTNCCK